VRIPKLIGVVHLPPLPGSPLAHGEHPVDILQKVGMQAVEEAQMLAQAGYDGVILENFGDTPFYKDQVPAETVAALSIIAAAVREVVDIQVGINVLRNDGKSALAIAAVTGCDFIRVNVLSGLAATDQGLVEGDAAFLIRERARLNVPVGILADVHVKHAITLSSFDLGLAIEEVGLRAMADGVIITGRTTGRLVDSQALQYASQVARAHKIPLLIGSGANSENLKEIQPWVDGIIVGSHLRKGGVAGAPLDLKRTKDFASQFLKMSKSKKTKKRDSASKKRK
jgi:membrane complex biogenesis BtpA family protein